MPAGALPDIRALVPQRTMKDDAWAHHSLEKVDEESPLETWCTQKGYSDDLKIIAGAADLSLRSHARRTRRSVWANAEASLHSG